MIEHKSWEGTEAPRGESHRHPVGVELKEMVKLESCSSSY